MSETCPTCRIEMEDEAEALKRRMLTLDLRRMGILVLWLDGMTLRRIAGLLHLSTGRVQQLKDQGLRLAQSRVSFFSDFP